MTLPLSGPLTLHQIAAEFGIPAASVFPTAFYGKGGAPASGALTFADFYGRSLGGSTGSGVRIFTTPCDAVAFDPADANAIYQLAASGVGSCSGIADWNWMESGAAADYQVMATAAGGSLSAGTMNTWLPLNVTRAWARNRLTPGVISAQISLQIRRASDSVIIATASISFNATVEV